jgi:hypothetical protein
MGKPSVQICKVCSKGINPEDPRYRVGLGSMHVGCFEQRQKPPD